MKSSLMDSLFDEEERRPSTVSEINEQVRGALERRFASVWIEAEIVNFHAASSGHWYFTLHDGASQIKAACYSRNNSRIRFKPFDGLQVRVRGKLSLYIPRGEYQIQVESLQPVGEGALRIAFEQVRSKLEKERLFDVGSKRPLPYLPRRVGIVTSPNGAAFHDILHVLSRRTRSVHITLIPTLVQGEYAGEEITRAIEKANSYNLIASETERFDVLIVGRGGGSAEDLWAFNEEIVARAIFASEIPVISAVGHETDSTIADLVADRFAPTPSAAAEIVAESEDRIDSFIAQRKQDLFRLINYKLLGSRNGLQELALAPVFSEFPQRIKDWKYQLEDLRDVLSAALDQKFKNDRSRLESLAARISPLKLAGRLAEQKTLLAVLREKQAAAVKGVLDNNDEKLKIRMASLNALSPLAVLNRGYSITKSASGEILRDAEKSAIGENVRIQLAKGRIEARVVRRDLKKNR